MMKHILKFFFLFLISCTASAQSIVSDSAEYKDTLKTFRLSVQSNFPECNVYIDTSFIGITPITSYEIKEGSYTIKVTNTKSLKNWDSENKTFDIAINKDTILFCDFHYFYYFNSNPFGANVYSKDSVLGITPLRFFSKQMLSGSITFSRKNYKDYFFDLRNYNFETGLNVTLEPKGTQTVNDIVYKNRGTQFKTKRALVPILFLGAAAVGGAFFAVTYKNRANVAYDTYLINGSQSSLDESNDNDRYYVISLVLMQAAIGGLIYFLFFD